MNACLAKCLRNVCVAIRNFVLPLAVVCFFACFLPDFAFAKAAIDASTSQNGLAVMFFGLFIGVVIAAAAYLFFIWVVMRDRGQVFLLIFLLCIGAHIVNSSDLLMAQMGIVSPGLRDFLSHFSIVMSWVFGLFFTFYYLELDIYSPEYRTPFATITLLLLAFLVYSIIAPVDAGDLIPIVGTMAVSTILTGGLAGIRNDTSGSSVHLIAFSAFLCGLVAEPAYALGYIKQATTAHNLTFMAYALSAMFFAIVVASQFAARQDEKEKELAISNERFMLATRGANEGLFDWNLATGEVFFSDQLRKILNVRLANNGDGLKRWVRMMLPADRRIVTDALRRFRRNAKTSTINVEYRIVHMDGERRWLHSKAVAMRDKHTQKILRLVGSTSDVTQRKLNEVALRASEIRFRSITEAHPVPVLIASLVNEALLYVSPGAEQLLGVRLDPNVPAFLEQVVPDADCRKGLVQEVSANHSVDLRETIVRRGNDEQMPAALSARRITFQDTDAMVIGIYDLTERKKAETKIAQQQEALQQSEKMAALGGLLAGVAHELNNPLSVVVGQSTLLMEGTADAKVSARAEKIFKAADRCSRIVKSFLALARRKPPEHKSVELNQIIRASLELLGYQLKTGDVTLETQLDDKLPEIIGDGDQLTQVFTNLVLNAAQALDGWNGKRRITVASKFDNGHVIVSVSDSGPGIPAEIRTRVFEPFFTTKSSKGGTGVGLALCVNIVASHGGELSLTDTPGGGATFTVKLPALTASANTTAGDESQEAASGEKWRLLLVDDEVELAQTLADLLEPLGHTVDIAANGAIAMEKLHKFPFDAVISDLRMPVMDGPALFEALQRELPSMTSRIIYVTGDTLSSHVQNFLANNTVPVVEKPYRLKDIRRALSDLMKNATHKG